MLLLLLLLLLFFFCCCCSFFVVVVPSPGPVFVGGMCARSVFDLLVGQYFHTLKAEGHPSYVHTQRALRVFLMMTVK